MFWSQHLLEEHGLLLLLLLLLTNFILPSRSWRESEAEGLYVWLVSTVNSWR